MIINGYDEYNVLKLRMDAEPYIQTRIHRDLYAHPSINPILCAAVTFINGDAFVYSVSHNDAPMFEEITTSNEINGDAMLYANNHKLPEVVDYHTPYIQHTHMMFSQMKDINKIIPLMAWSSILKRYNHNVLERVEFSKTYTYTFLDNAVKCLRTIETAGLAIDPHRFNTFFEHKSQRYVHNNRVYSQYYPYTTTGRPSNRYGGINFAALNKSDGSRSAFVSRFDGGKLVQLDFESYHLRLIANYMNVTLPDEPIHEYLAKQYFGKQQITSEEYEEGKQITFSILYGADVETDIPLLASIKELSKDVYKSYLEMGCLVAPLSKRRIYVEEAEAAENKLFNYFVQNYEFEFTVRKLQRLVEFLTTKQSRLILYTYDAVLLDCHPDEINAVANEAAGILGDGGYPMRSFIGTDYDNLVKGSIVF